MNMGQLRPKEEEELSTNVLCAARFQDQCCGFIGEGPEGRLYISWEIDRKLV